MEFKEVAREKIVPDRTLVINIVPDNDWDYWKKPSERVNEDFAEDDRDDYGEKPSKRVKISTAKALASRNVNSSNVLRSERRQVHSASFSAQSPFFAKLFSSWAWDPQQSHVTITTSEEDSFINMLQFMETHTLCTASFPKLLEIVVTADKFDVPQCVASSCERLLNKAMTIDQAVQHLELPEFVLSTTAPSLATAAKQYLDHSFKGATSNNEEILDLSFHGIEAVFSSDDLEIDSEDIVLDLFLKWCRSRYPQTEKRQAMMVILSHLIRFPFISSKNLRRALELTDFNPEYIRETVLDALSFKADLHYRQQVMSRNLRVNKRYIQRCYTYKPVRVVEQDHLRTFTVYLSVKHEEIARLLPDQRMDSELIYFEKQAFFVSLRRNFNFAENDLSLGLYLGMAQKGLSSCPLEYKFSCLMHLLSKTYVDRLLGICVLRRGFAVGTRDIFNMIWAEITDKDMIYYINDNLNLKIEVQMLEQS